MSVIYVVHPKDHMIFFVESGIFNSLLYSLTAFWEGVGGDLLDVHHCPHHLLCAPHQRLGHRSILRKTQEVIHRLIH